MSNYTAKKHSNVNFYPHISSVNVYRSLLLLRYLMVLLVPLYEFLPEALPSKNYVTMCKPMLGWKYTESTFVKTRERTNALRILQ